MCILCVCVLYHILCLCILVQVTGILDSAELIVIPFVNPDGYVVSAKECMYIQHVLVIVHA